MTSRLLVIVGTVLSAALALSVGESRELPSLRATAGGGMELVSSRDGQAVLTVSRLAPGGSAEGTLVLSNAAPADQRLTLSTADLRDVPGPGGGVLSERLDLRVERGGDVVFAGKLADLESLDLGDLPPGASHGFRFVVTLPESGPAVDTAYAGSSVEVGWSWRGDGDAGPETEKVKPEPEPEPERPDPPVAAPVVPDSPAEVGPSGDPVVEAPAPSVDELEGPAPLRRSAVRLWLGGRAAQRLGGGFGLSAACRPGCALRAAAQVRVGGRWRALGRRALGRVAPSSQPSAVRFRLSALQRRSLAASLRRHGQLVVRISVTAVADGHRSVTKVRSLRLRP
jgi:hypothetical protein